MALPKVFANISELDTPDLDSNFNALGALSVIPCTAAGTNTIALTPVANTPTISAYSNEAPIFGFVAAATSTGNVTISVSGLSALNLYKAHGNTQAAANDILTGRVYYVGYDLSLNSGAGGFFLVADQSATQSPNIQIFTSGTAQTYTTPVGSVYLRVRMVGPGGGGGGATANAGTTPSADTTFGTWTAIRGNGGGAGNAAGGAGGTGGATGTGTVITRVSGAAGVAGASTSASGSSGGQGGSSFFGGAGAPTVNSTGGDAAANTGSGGAGGGGTTAVGAGGGAGEFVEFIITSPAATYTYTVPAGGAGGIAGGHAGGAGAAGRIEVLAFL